MMHPDILAAVAAAHRDDLVRAAGGRTGRVVPARRGRERRLRSWLEAQLRRPGRQRPCPPAAAAAGRC